MSEEERRRTRQQIREALEMAEEDQRLLLFKIRDAAPTLREVSNTLSVLSPSDAERVVQRLDRENVRDLRQHLIEYDEASKRVAELRSYLP